MKITPLILNGNWQEGFALDLHTSSSFPVKNADGSNATDSSGNIKWDTKRPEIAEALYQLKYCKDSSKLESIAAPAADFLKKLESKWNIDLIVPIPPSDTTRAFQPVYELGKLVSKKLSVPIDFEALKKTKSTSALKAIDDPAKRKEMLVGVFQVEQNYLAQKNVLLFDDLYRSGETLMAAAKILKEQGGARAIYVLTITKTRSKK